MKRLRHRLVQAGIYDPHAAAYFFIARTALALGVALASFFVLQMLGIYGKIPFWLFVMASGLGGYLAPSVYLDRRVALKRREHQAGFPDFMDLRSYARTLALPWRPHWSGSGANSAIRHPSLAANIHMANLEIRAGRTLTEALDHLGDRLGLEEARSFATLIQQSAELGSSVSDALRVYSEDMRHKRMSRAEEKAYSLPAKLAVPMMVCIFPVLFIVILLPVIVRLVTHNW